MPENSSCSGASSCSKASCEGCSHNSQNPQSMLEAMNAYSNIKHVIGVVSGREVSVNHLLLLPGGTDGESRI